MVSLARNAADVVTSIESRLVANAVAGAHRARRDAWLIVVHI